MGPSAARSRNFEGLDLHLHIGMNKVASTAIQECLALNRRALLDRHGLLVPETGMGRPDRGGKSHYVLSETLGYTNDPAFLPPDDARIAALREAFLDEVARIRPRAVLMSSEFFVLRRDVRRVRAFFDGFDVKIVVYLRRHDAWLRSLYAQAIQTAVAPRWDRSFESFLAFQDERRSQYLSYLELSNAWAAVFGEGSLRPRAYAEDGATGAVTTDFLSVVGVEDARHLVFPSRRHNAAPSAQALSLLDLLQRAELPAESRAAAIAELLRADDPAAPRLALHPSTQARVLARFGPEYAVISDRFMDGKPLFPVPAIPREPGDGTTILPPPVFSPATLQILNRHLAPEAVAAIVR
jgi:hypothetical protein